MAIAPLRTRWQQQIRRWRHTTKRFISLAIVFVLALSFVLSWNLDHGIAAKPNFGWRNQPPEIWQLEGTLAALDDTNPLVVATALRELSELDRKSVV